MQKGNSQSAHIINIKVTYLTASPFGHEVYPGKQSTFKSWNASVGWFLRQHVRQKNCKHNQFLNTNNSFWSRMNGCLSIECQPVPGYCK
uniref:Uncharacterized protein n=1 Tax=Solanum lycopersicum TaxID=4081 RepID=A0A3Q7HQ63_SOLLC